MKSKIKLIIIVSVAVLLLGGAVLALVLTAPEEEEEAPADSTPQSTLLFDKDFKTVGRLTVTNEFGTYEIHRYGDDPEAYVWGVPEYIESPMSMSRIADIIAACSTLTAQKTVTESAEDLSIYGLAEPSVIYKTEFDDAALTVKEVCIGGNVPGSGSYRYMCMKGENKVYTVKYTDVSCLFNDKRDIIEKTVYTLRSAKDENDTTNYSRINKLTVSRRDIDYDIVIEYDTRLDDDSIMTGNSTSYRMTAPVVLDLNPDKCVDVMNGIFGLTASDFAALTPTDSELTEYGFDDPLAEISFDIAGVDHVRIIVGNDYKDEEGRKTGYYARVEGVDPVYIFDRSSLPWAYFMPLDITSTMITSNYVFNITSMNVVTSDMTANFTMTGSSDKEFEVKLNGRDVDKDAFKKFYQFILAAPSEELCFDEVSGEPRVRVEIITPDNTDVLEFYTAASRRSVICLNGAPSFSCKTAYAERLAENLLKFAGGEDIISTW